MSCWIRSPRNSPSAFAKGSGRRFRNTRSAIPSWRPTSGNCSRPWLKSRRPRPTQGFPQRLCARSATIACCENLAAAAWAWSTRRSNRRSAGAWRSKCSRFTPVATPRRWIDSNARPARQPGCITRTSFPSSRSARPATCAITPCSSFRAKASIRSPRSCAGYARRAVGRDPQRPNLTKAHLKSRRTESPTLPARWRSRC